jgi:hypothetical protein
VKSHVALIGLLFIGSAGALNAAPLDSPEIVYIDGTPCNRLCQSYMAWSRETLYGRGAQNPSNATERPAQRTSIARSKPAARERLPKQATPAPHQARRDIARLQRPAENATSSPDSKPAQAIIDAAPSSVGKPTEESAERQQPADMSAPSSVSKPAEQVAGVQQPAVNASPTSPDKTPAPDSLAGSADQSKTRAIQKQVIAATALAEQLTSTAAAAPELKAMSSEHSDNAGATTSDGSTAVLASRDDASTLVALVMSRSEIKSVTDLAGKSIAIDTRESKASTDVRIALVAAGASEVQLTSGETKAIDRLVSGDVPAAVLTLVSADAANAFPEIAGFNVFRVPLSPGSLKAQPDTH